MPILLLMLACHREQPAFGNAERGKQLVSQYGCNVCHVVPGIEGPRGMIGPSLEHVASRPRLSNDTFANTPENVARFVQTPVSLNPASSMPPLNIPPDDARDLTAYLMTLR
ncbi:MAG TPA: cytochrome c [Thermoanaerobaculia bacterium]|nr:cytochrome c [Thermoanaerobaculia bacterium]